MTNIPLRLTLAVAALGALGACGAKQDLPQTRNDAIDRAYGSGNNEVPETMLLGKSTLTTNQDGEMAAFVPLVNAGNVEIGAIGVLGAQADLSNEGPGEIRQRTGYGAGVSFPIRTEILDGHGFVGVTSETSTVTDVYTFNGNHYGTGQESKTNTRIAAGVSGTFNLNRLVCGEMGCNHRVQERQAAQASRQPSTF